MEKRPGLEDHYANLEAHQFSSMEMEEAQSAYDSALDFRTESTPEEETVAEELLAEAKGKLDKVQAEYDKIVAEGKEIGNTNKNLELLLEASRDELERLMSKARELEQRIGLFQQTLDQEKELSEIDLQSVPDFVEKDIKDPAGVKRVTTLFMQMIANRLAKFESMGTKPNLTPEDTESIWYAAMRQYLRDPKKDPIIKAPAGWTGWSKGRPQ